jgi:cyclopropane fatty-acyl-phospholipid synthase-like methyltransferase
MHLLDIGCGIGGPSRLFAQEHGCRVTGIDLTADYVRTAEALVLACHGRTFHGATEQQHGLLCRMLDSRAAVDECRRRRA